jgi:hypothetical protein
LENDITAKLQRELFDYYTRLKLELDQEFVTQLTLTESHAVAQEGRQALEEFRVRLQQAHVLVEEREVEADRWSKAQDEAPPLAKETLIKPYDPVCGVYMGEGDY